MKMLFLAIRLLFSDISDINECLYVDFQNYLVSLSQHFRHFLPFPWRKRREEEGAVTEKEWWHR